MIDLDQEILFSNFDLDKSILDALTKAQYLKPTPIQARVIPLLLAGKDVVGQAHTGTGKTLAFGLPALHFVKTQPGAQVLVLSPVRELAGQIQEELHRFAGEKHVQMTIITGGKSFSRQIESVRNGSQMVVATPGRLLDLLESGKLPNFKPRMVIIDEADEMLDQGFLEDIKAILNYFPEDRQTLLFSATMPEPIRQLAKTFLHHPEFVQIVQKEKTNQNIEQFYTLVEPQEREAALVRFLDTEFMSKVIVFCNTKKEVDYLYDKLLEKKYHAMALHGDMEQGQRQKVMSAFRRSHQGILIATEVAARGLNVEDVTHVFNYELPWGAETYVHRIGRTGRAGKLGKAISFVTPKEFYAFERICKTLSAPVAFLAVPPLSRAKEKKAWMFVEHLKSIEPDVRIESALDQIVSTFSMEEALRKLLHLQLKDQEVTGPELIGLDLNKFRSKGKKETSSQGPRRSRGFREGKRDFRSQGRSGRGRGERGQERGSRGSSRKSF
jgi:ATP-dependent RNA helicase DeaD